MQRAQQAEELRAATWQDRRNALPSLALGAACPAPAATSNFQPHWPGLGSRHHTPLTWPNPMLPRFNPLEGQEVWLGCVLSRGNPVSSGVTGVTRSAVELASLS